jgi:hypothetical protein
MKLRVVFLALTLGLLPSLTASPAHAAGCVNKAEFKKAKNGMSQAKIAQIFGTNGKVITQSSGFGISMVMRDYKTCSPYNYGSVSIMFTNNKVDTKTALWF